MQVSRYDLSEVPGFVNMIHDDKDTPDILKLNKIECRTSNNARYSVIRYEKDILVYDLIPTYGLCRSIIVNSQNKVVSFAPPKSIQSDIFIQNYGETSDGVTAEEFVEGTMINVFWDQTIGLNGGWEIATRNTPGATSRFFKSSSSKKTFRDMFLEATEQHNLNFNMLNPYYCYSFVLQHPENRIVVPFKKPQLYVVAIYSIEYVDNHIFVNSFEPRQLVKDVFEVNNVTIQFPEKYTFTTYAQLIEKYASMNTSYDIVGVVLHNRTTGERAKIRNPVYEQVRLLRGNQPKLQYQYLCLRKEGKVSEFLKFYPENKKPFFGFRDQVHLFTNTLFDNYKACYIKKEKPLKDFSDQYRTHMFHIHQIYLSDLRTENQFVTSTIVQKYVNEIHPSLLMYCLNFQMRKRNVDTIKSTFDYVEPNSTI
jgi:hypothetical protein